MQMTALTTVLSNVRSPKLLRHPFQEQDWRQQQLIGEVQLFNNLPFLNLLCHETELCSRYQRIIDPCQPPSRSFRDFTTRAAREFFDLRVRVISRIDRTTLSTLMAKMQHDGHSVWIRKSGTGTHHPKGSSGTCCEPRQFVARHFEVDLV